MPAITTTRGRFADGSERGSMPTAARHCAGKSAMTSHAPCRSTALSEARSSRRDARSLTIDVAMHDGGAVSERVEELSKLFDEGHGSVASTRAADGHREIGLALTLIERQQEAQQ